jgi:hypothetical protein
MIVAVEDVVSEAVVRRIVTAVRPDLTVSVVIGKHGRSYIQGRIRELNRTARSVPVLVLVDLDKAVPCPADLIESWLPSPRAPKLLFRLAVMEIESWLMADRDAIAEFLSVPLHRVPMNPDTVLQPKELIVSMARKSRRKEIRDDLVPADGDTRIVGPAFNARLTAFATNTWNPHAAGVNSPSLGRTLERLRSAFRSTD